MNKPEWKDAPSWAEYLAQDKCGAWYWFENEPKLGGGNWFVTYGDCQEADSNPDWINTLEGKS